MVEYRCFRCGTENETLMQNEEESAFGVCCSCGEESVVTFIQALDIINEYYLQKEEAYDFDI